MRRLGPLFGTQTTHANAELYTVGPDEVVVTFTTEPGAEVTTQVGDHAVVTTGPYHHARVDGLEPGTTYTLRVGDAAPTELCPPTVTTLARPGGTLRARFATVNDVHFGELVCGMLGTEEELGPVFSVADGDTPYPEVMNRGAHRGAHRRPLRRRRREGRPHRRGYRGRVRAVPRGLRRARRAHAPRARQPRRRQDRHDRHHGSVHRRTPGRDARRARHGDPAP